jgi:hypothetical protein
LSARFSFSVLAGFFLLFLSPPRDFSAIASLLRRPSRWALAYGTILSRRLRFLVKSGGSSWKTQ